MCVAPDEVDTRPNQQLKSQRQFGAKEWQGWHKVVQVTALVKNEHVAVHRRLFGSVR